MDECCLTTRVIKEVCKRAKNKYFQHMIRVDVTTTTTSITMATTTKTTTKTTAKQQQQQ